MATCNICKYAGRPTYKSPCSECKEFSKYEYENKKTNADRIRGMSDEELAETMNQKAIDTICDIVCGGECNAIATLHKTSNQVCKEIILDWLRQPYEGEGNIEISEG